MEEIAKTGHGRYYEENGGSLLAIVDNIVADAAVEHTGVETAKAPGKEVIVPLIASFFFILASLFLPQAREKRCS